MVAAAADGRHALLAAATGAGKTLAGFLPTLVELIESPYPSGEGLGEGAVKSASRLIDSPPSQPFPLKGVPPLSPTL